MLNSNLPQKLIEEVKLLVPDAFDDANEFWRIVPDTAPGWVYSVSSKRDILVRHTRVDNLKRIYKPVLVTMSLDACSYNTAIRRARKDLSTYIEHVRYDTFPELNEVKTLDDDLNDAVDVKYDGLDWYGRKRTSVHILPVCDSDMMQVRLFYPEDLPREIWTYVPNTNRKYVISSQSRGVILKRYRSNGQILKPQVWQLTSNRSSAGSGYYECCLTVGDRQLNSVAHAQIIRSFEPKPGDEYEVNHIDGDKHNNILDNLEWVTRQANSDHYNKSPEMAYKRRIGYKKISEFGKTYQKEIQNRPEVNAKRSATLKKHWTAEERARQSKISRERWQTISEDERKAQLAGILAHNQRKHQECLQKDEGC